MTSLGKPLPHESAHGHVTGAALYTDDLLGRFPAALCAWPVTAPHAHARMTSLDTTPALGVPGVVRVLTAADVLGENQVGAARPDEPLFPSEVMFHGQAVAWVLGETEEAARLGARAIHPSYEPLPAILSIEDGLAAGDFLTGELRLAQGDAKGALARAPRRLEGDLFMGGQEHFYLETQSALAHLDEQARVFVHSSTQHPSETQEIVARVLGVHKNDVTVQSLRMGGAFGGKEVQANTWAAVAALGTKLTGRPVRVRLNRAQDTSMTGKRHPFLGRFEVSFDDTGKLLALRMQLFADGGWSLDLSEPILYRALFHSDNAYRIPDVELVGRVVRTHKTSMTAFRGFGGPQGMLMIEEVLDRIARTLGLPPHLVRQRNFYQEGDRTPYAQLVKDPGRMPRIWQELSESSHFSERWRQVAEHNAKSPHVKRGLAITPVKFGISFTTAFFNQGSALVLIYADGSVQVNHGGTEMGQGLHTKMLQVAAHTLGVPIETVRLMPTQTDKVPNTSATAASSGSDLNGAAVKAACETLRERLAEVAAAELGVSAAEVVFDEGKVFAKHAPERALAFGHVTHQAYLARVPLSTTGYYRTPDIHFDKATGTGKPFHYFAYGAAVTEVEVDGFTGMYSIARVDILHDAGESLSPLVDRGQVEGGFMQGLGWLTLEELRWTSEGRLATPNASTYKLPGLGECPPVFEVKLLERAAEPSVVYGSKAVGEPPFMLAISVREALRQAVAAFGDGRPGVVELASPATPEAVFWAIEKLRARAKLERAAE
ncbi:MAG: xanthine dehydrogenase molybdopterin binding subunit [Myxococcales bacterium]|nr:xanthine dehydrogenase molybdopterin binding subunit [Myxococcales bacterium]